jgi:hypothetical protein
MATPFFPTNEPLFIVNLAQISASGIFTEDLDSGEDPNIFSSSIYISSSTFEIFNSRSLIYYNDGTSPTYTSGLRPDGAGTAALGALPLLCDLNSIQYPLNKITYPLVTSNPAPYTSQTNYTYATLKEGDPDDLFEATAIQWTNWDGFNLNAFLGSTYTSSLTQISNVLEEYTNKITLKLNFSTNPFLSQSLYNGRLDVSAVYKTTGVNSPNSDDYRDGTVWTSDIINFYDTPPQSDIAILNGTTINNITWTSGSTNNYSCEFTFNQPIAPGGTRAVAFLLRLSFDTQTDIPPVIDYPELHLVYINPDGTFTSLQRINDTNFTEGNNSFSKTINLSQSFLPVENYKLGIAAKFLDNTTKFDNINITDFNFVTNPATTQSNTPDPVNVGSAFEENFTNNDWNALFGNAFIPRYSQYFMDVDYSTSPSIGSSLTPVNFNQLIAGTATRAPIQDYYYNLRRHIIPRYLGSRSTAPSFNAFSTDTKDKGFGKDIVAGNPKPFVGYYGAKGGSTPEVIGKTIINLDYIIDEDIQTQVPALSDFTYNNQLQLFERGAYLYLDPGKTATSQQFAGNRKYKIYRSGEYATPIVYSQLGTSAEYLPEMLFYPADASPIPYTYKFKDLFDLVKVTNTALSLLVVSGAPYVGNPLTYPDRNAFYRLIFRPGRDFTNNQAIPAENKRSPLDSNINEPDIISIHTYGSSEQFVWNDNSLFNLLDANDWAQLPINTTPSISSTYFRPAFLVYPISEPPNFTLDGSGTGPQKYTFPVIQFINIPPVNPSGINVKIKIKASYTLQRSYSNDAVLGPALASIRIIGIKPNGTFEVIPGASQENYFVPDGPPGANPITRTIEAVSSPIAPQDYVGAFIQGRIYFGSMYDNFLQLKSAPIRRGLITNFIKSSIFTATNFEINQDPPTNQIIVPAPYINNISSLPSNSSIGVITFELPMNAAYGDLYPQVPTSGYDSTIYPFSIEPSINDINDIDYSTPPEYEIRFGADEDLVFPILASSITTDPNGGLQLFIENPLLQSLSANVNPFLQSFLIRRWVPRAGYIYLDVAADLGSGIVKPEYITDDIKNKIPQIVKELTDKGLIQ